MCNMPVTIFIMLYLDDFVKEFIILLPAEGG
jgi:hypothetical protein